MHMPTHSVIRNRIEKIYNRTLTLYGNSTEQMTTHYHCETMWGLLPQSVIQNPDELYLDYAVGKGTLLAYGVIVLFDALQDAIPDETERLNHIITTQLYGVDIRKPQADIARSTLRRMLDDPLADINITCENSLTKDFHSMNKKFNLITNYPFQDGKNPNLHMEFRVNRNNELKDILKHKVTISPNIMAMTSTLPVNYDKYQLAAYIDDGNSAFDIILPAGTCITHEVPENERTETVSYTDINGNTRNVKHDDFFLITSSLEHVIQRVNSLRTVNGLDGRYIHGKRKLSDDRKENNGKYFYVHTPGATGAPVVGFNVDLEQDDIVHSGSFVVFSYNASGNAKDLGKKKLGPIKVLPYGNYIFSNAVVALRFDTDVESKNCASMLESEWAKETIRAVKYATNNSKALLSIMPEIDFNREFDEQVLYNEFG
jgi:hypothetical protein